MAVSPTPAVLAIFATSSRVTSSPICTKTVLTELAIALTMSIGPNAWFPELLIGVVPGILIVRMPSTRLSSDLSFSSQAAST